MNDKKNKKILKLINKLFKEYNVQEIGVIISWISYEYINTCEITKKQYFESLKNSLKIIEKHMEEKNERNTKNDE